MISCLPPSIPDPPLLTDAAGDVRLRSSSSGPRPPIALRLLNQTRTLSQLKQAHARILRHGLAQHPAVVAALIRLYSSHRRLDLASAVFSPAVATANTFHWNLMIRGYVSNGSPVEALRLYNLLISQGFPSPDKFTFPFAITACSALSHLPKGMELHSLAIKAGFSDDNYVQNALIHLYYTCGAADCARRVFDRMPIRTVGSWTALVSGLVGLGDLDAAKQAFDEAPDKNVVTWTAMIDGFAKNGRPDEAFELFHSMLAHDVRPNAFTVVALLIACNELGSLHLGRRVHDYARANSELSRNLYVGTALIDMYSKCGSLEDAVKVFDEMPVRSLATWNSMITSMGVHGRGTEAIALFREMERSGLKPDRITLFGVLCACSSAGTVEEACEVFKYMVGCYGIVPELEHYKRMAELFGSAIVCGEEEDEIVDLAKELIGEMDDAGLQLMLEACRYHADVKLEGVVSSCIHELEISSGGGGSSEAQLQQLCFSWEVG